MCAYQNTDLASGLWLNIKEKMVMMFPQKNVWPPSILKDFQYLMMYLSGHSVPLIKYFVLIWSTASVTVPHVKSNKINNLKYCLKLKLFTLIY